MSAPSPTSPWLRPAALFVAVSAIIFGLAIWQPFEPGGAPAAQTGLTGDPAAGEGLYAEGCAGCHGAGGEGGVGPALVDRGLDEELVATTVASGRGTMPAGIFAGQDAQDVAAFVAQLSGGAPATDAPGPASEPPDVAAGRVELFGDNLWGVAVTLDAPAPADWTVAIAGPNDAQKIVGRISAGASGLREPNVGPPPVIDTTDRILVGADLASPALVAEIPSVEADRMRRLSNAHPDTPRGVAALDGAGAQIAVLDEHTSFLVEAVTEGNAANLRLHAEHLVNIAEGDPIADLDGDGTPTNPGDGFGLTGDGYLSLIAADGGDDVGAAIGALEEAVSATAGDARVCAVVVTVAAGDECAAAIEGRAEAIVSGWDAVQKATESGFVADLVEVDP